MKPLNTLALLVAVSLNGCNDSGSQGHTTPLPVTVSIEPQRQLLSAIGGNRVEVTSLLANGTDPETYDPTLASLMSLENSLAWFQIGNIPFEQQLSNRIGPQLTRFDTSTGIDLIEGTHGHDHADHHHDHDGRHDHSHDGIDPHTWSSVRNMKIIGANMLAGLIEIDPAGKDYYTARFDSVATRLDSLDACYTRRLAPARGSTFMVWHPSLSYFARDYGLRQISVAADHRETSLISLQSTIDDAIANGVEVFFEQSSYDPRLSATVRQHIGAVCSSFNPLDYDWEQSLDNVVSTIAAHSPASIE